MNILILLIIILIITNIIFVIFGIYYINTKINNQTTIIQKYIIKNFTELSAKIYNNFIQIEKIKIGINDINKNVNNINNKIDLISQQIAENNKANNSSMMD